jgi:hypothetical protein
MKIKSRKDRKNNGRTFITYELMENKDQVHYPFGWLDEIVATNLNPQHTMASRIDQAELAGWQQQLRSETGSIWKNLKSQAFFLLSPKKVTAMLTHYQDSLEDLKRQAMVNMAAYPEDNPLNSFCGQVLTELGQLQTQFQRRYARYLTDNHVPSHARSTGMTEGQAPPYKITCRLSVDQIAIILKAADDIRLLTARSFSLVLRSITPYLSTERMQDFSWKSARSSAMKMEDRDKQLTVTALEELIKKIKSY